jgi:hypothetical protein
MLALHLLTNDIGNGILENTLMSNAAVNKGLTHD